MLVRQFLCVATLGLTAPTVQPGENFFVTILLEMGKHAIGLYAVSMRQKLLQMFTIAMDTIRCGKTSGTEEE